VLRLSNWTVLIIGVSVSVIILSWSYFWHYTGDVQVAKDETDLAKSLHTNAGDAQKAEVRKEQAQTKVAQAFDEWRRIVVNHAPPASTGAGGMDMAVNGYYMPIYAHQYRNNLQVAVNNQVKVGGVKVINGPTIPDPGDSGPDIVANFFNYPAIPFPMVIFDLGQITVQGTYQQIKANVLGWASMPNYFAVSDGLALNGTSPILTATYSVSMIGYIRGKTIYPGLPTAAAPENVAVIKTAPAPAVPAKTAPAKAVPAKVAPGKPPVGRPAQAKPAPAPTTAGAVKAGVPRPGTRSVPANAQPTRGPAARPGAPATRGPVPAGQAAPGGKG